jgi:hypothetical protein
MDVAPLIPITYAGPVWYYALLAYSSKVIIESKEHFVKQSYRNKCVIDGANGAMSLVIPLERKSREKTLISEIKIANETPWQALHWKSIQAAYHHSPYFEFYEDHFVQFYLEPQENLMEFNLQIMHKFMELLQIECEIEFTDDFHHEYKNDFREAFSTKNKVIPQFERYIQVFEDRHPFLQNLSVFDVLFNLGPEGLIYLKRAPISV